MASGWDRRWWPRSRILEINMLEMGWSKICSWKFVAVIVRKTRPSEWNMNFGKIVYVDSKFADCHGSSHGRRGLRQVPKYSIHKEQWPGTLQMTSVGRSRFSMTPLVGVSISEEEEVMWKWQWGGQRTRYPPPRQEWGVWKKKATLGKPSGEAVSSGESPVCLRAKKWRACSQKRLRTWGILLTTDCEFQRAQWKVWGAEERGRNGVWFGMLERSVGDKAPC